MPQPAMLSSSSEGKHVESAAAWAHWMPERLRMSTESDWNPRSGGGAAGHAAYTPVRSSVVSAGNSSPKRATASQGIALVHFSA
jgi:hypothetical protein